jgi:hypothetical protein
MQVLLGCNMPQEDPTLEGWEATIKTGEARATLKLINTRVICATSSRVVIFVTD